MIFWVAQPYFWVTSAEQKEAQNMKNSSRQILTCNFFKTVYNCTIVHVHKSHIREIVPQLKIFVNQIPPPNCLHNIEFCRISFVPIFLQLSHPFFLMKYFWDNPENFYNSWKPPRRLETLAMIRNFAAPPETSQSIKKPLPDSFLSVQQLFRLSGNFWSCWISCSSRCKSSCWSRWFVRE